MLRLLVHSNLRRYRAEGGKTMRYLSSAGSPRICPKEEANPSADAVAWEDARPFEEIPGPKPLPLIGNVHRFLPFGEYYTPQGDHTYFLGRLSVQYGPIAKMSGFNLLGRPDFVFIFDPKEGEKVYRHSGQWPMRGGVPSLAKYRKEARKEFYDGVYGLLITEGEEWFKFRSAVNKVLMRPQIVKLYHKGIDRVASDFTERIRRIRNTDGELPLNFENELCKWALESVGLVAFDTRLGCLEDLPAESEQQKLITAVLLWFELWYQLDGTPNFYYWIETKNWRKFVANADYVVGVAMKLINEAVERMESGSTDDSREKSVVERLIAIDKKIAVVMALDMVLAGIDTTAQTVSRVLYYLAVTPDKQEKLRAELRQVAPEGSINAENSNDLFYLRACIKEALRIAPIVYANQRSVPKDIVLSGYQVPEGTRVVLCHKEMSHMEKYFPEAKKFVPERWLRSNEESSVVNKFASLPFGHGARSCIGKRFAEMEVEALIAKLITNFDVSWNYGEMQYRTKILYTTATPLKFKLTDRSSAVS